MLSRSGSKLRRRAPAGATMTGLQKNVGEPALELDATLLPHRNEIIEGRRNVGQDSVPAALRDPGFQSTDSVVDLVPPEPELGTADVAVGVEIHKSLALRLKSRRSLTGCASSPVSASAASARRVRGTASIPQTRPRT